MRLLHFGIILALATAGFADTITLKNGRVINGTYLGGTTRQVRVEIADQIQTFEISEIARIEFGGGAPAASARQDARPDDRRLDTRPTLRRADNAAPAQANDSDRPVLRRTEDSNVFRP